MPEGNKEEEMVINEKTKIHDRFHHVPSIYSCYLSSASDLTISNSPNAHDYGQRPKAFPFVALFHK